MNKIVVLIPGNPFRFGFADEKIPRTFNPESSSIEEQFERVEQDLGPLRDKTILFVFNSCYNCREYETQLFERFEIASFASFGLQYASVLPTGRLSGTLVDIAHDYTSVYSVYTGYPSMNYGYPSISNLFKHDEGQYIKKWDGDATYTKEDIEIIRDKCGYVALDYEEQVNKSKLGQCDAQVTLTRGTITVAKERFYFTEAFFEGEQSIPARIHYTITQQTDVELRPLMTENVILVGELSMIPQFAERLKAELTKLDSEYKVIAEPWRNHSAWVGATIIAKSEEFVNFSKTMEEYEESGPSNRVNYAIPNIAPVEIMSLEDDTLTLTNSFQDVSIKYHKP
jgi:hypothetical protein